eukprot:2683259-Rhodomonas_salina.3
MAKTNPSLFSGDHNLNRDAQLLEHPLALGKLSTPNTANTSKCAPARSGENYPDHPSRRSGARHRSCLPLTGRVPSSQHSHRSQAWCGAAASQPDAPACVCTYKFTLSRGDASASASKTAESKQRRAGVSAP